MNKEEYKKEKIKKTKSRVLTICKNENYELLSEVRTMHDKIYLRHNDCGYDWWVTPHNFLGNAGKKPRRCPICFGSSMSELFFMELLKNNNFKWRKEYSFGDCKSKESVYRFDFAIFDTNNNVSVLVELHGRQHREICGGYFTEEVFRRRQIDDENKRRYCKENNLLLVEIPVERNKKWKDNSLRTDIILDYFTKYIMPLKNTYKEAL